MIERCLRCLSSYAIMGNKMRSVLFICLLSYIVMLHSVQVKGLQFSDYETLSFSNPNQNSLFTRLAIHNETGSIYIGGGDTLYRLAADFTGQESVNTAGNCGEDQCPCPTNYNKILLIDNAGNMLITCGSESSSKSDPGMKGTCQTRALDNIEVPIRDDGTSVVASGTLSTEAIIAPGPENGGADTLYVAATYDEERYDSQVYPVTRRILSASSRSDIIFDLERDARVLLNRAIYPDTPFLINYVHGFVKDHEETSTHYTYFVSSQRQDSISREDMEYFSKINRVCQDSDNGFYSYAEILLDCQGTNTSDKYNLIQAAHVGSAGAELATSLGLNPGDDIFYGVFAKNQGQDGNIPSNQSALCVFKLEDIEEKFIDAIFGCLNDGGYYHLRYLQGSTCPGFGSITRDQAKGQQCSAANWALADGLDPLVSTAVIEWPDTLPSSIITATHRNHTIAFVGTAHGDLVKIHIDNKTCSREYERFSVGSPVLRDAAMDEAQEMITILTEQTLLKLRVEKCSEFLTCDDCIGGNGEEDGDPYCGWCTLEKMCSRHDECPMADVSTRWLPYNNVQCAIISNVAPYPNQPITAPLSEITLTVQQLPDLSDEEFYECAFNDVSNSRAEKNGNKLKCNTPKPSDIPHIPEGNDHVTMKLSVYSTETRVQFVDSNYDFYECSSHTMCVSCTNSSWACDWCIYSDKCTHDNNTCAEDDSSSVISGINNPNKGPNQGFEKCPQLAPQDDDVLVSVGVNRPITVSALNLPQENKVEGYECTLHVEGNIQRTGATRSGNNIVCEANSYTYSEDLHTLRARLSVLWNGDRLLDDVYGFDVILYRCEVGRPDCSRCLSNQFTKSEFGCGWCQDDSFCNVEDSPECNAGWVPPTTNINCPNPLLTGVSPHSGPFEGNTIITISGTDIGKKFSDVLSVTVGGESCSTEDFQDHYMVGSSVRCRTLPGDEDADEIIVTIMGSDGNPQESTGWVVFWYRNPTIFSFDPSEGPVDGGTVVTIRGMYLDAGYEIVAKIGSDCIVDSNTVNETTATCRTTNSTVNRSHTLVMSFDGATRESEQLFTYRPNPQVSDVQPRSSILSGGRLINVTGVNLRLAQEPKIIVYGQSENYIDTCNIIDDTLMTCKTPNTMASFLEMWAYHARHKRAGEDPTKMDFGFLIGDVQSLREWSKNNSITLDYFDDPYYEHFTSDPEKYIESTLILEGQKLNLASSKKDVKVFVGPEEGSVQSLDEDTLVCRIPQKNPGAGDYKGNNTQQGLPYVIVVQGNLEFNIGRLQYPEFNIGRLQYPESDVPLEIILPVVISISIALVFLALAIWYKGKYTNILQKEEDLLDRLRNLQQQKQVVDEDANGSEDRQEPVDDAQQSYLMTTPPDSYLEPMAATDGDVSLP